MINNKILITLLMATALSIQHLSAQTVSIYPLPPLTYPFSGSDAYTVSVAGQNCPIYVLEGATNASFSFSGTVTLRVRPKASFTSYKIQPAEYNILSSREGNEIVITLSDPTKSKFSINFDNNDTRNLFILGDPPETDVPSPTDPNVIYIKAGVNYTHASGRFPLRSNKTLYVEPGAVLYGRLDVSGSNIKILGRGFIVDHLDVEDAVNLYSNCSNLTIQGVHLGNGAKWTNSFHTVVGLNIDHVKFLYQGNETDATSFNYGTKNVSFKNSFIYNGDNVFVLESADTRDILIDNIVIYMNGGGHIVYPQGFGGGGTDLGGNIVLQNLHIIHPARNSKLYTTYWSPSTAIGAIESVHIENVWIDGTMGFIYLDVDPVKTRHTSFKNIYFSNPSSGLLDANGYQFTFENIYYGTNKVQTVAGLNIQNNGNNTLTFITTGSVSSSSTIPSSSSVVSSSSTQSVTVIQNGTILEAEVANLGTGNGTKPTGVVAYNDVGEYLYYPQVEISNTIDSVLVTYGVPSPYQGNIAEFRLGSTSGTLVGSLTLQSTASWETMRTDATALSPWTGAQDLYVVFKQGTSSSTWIGDFDKFTFHASESTTRLRNLPEWLGRLKSLKTFDLMGRAN